MKIRTNHTVEYLKSRINYYNEFIASNIKYKELVQKDLEKLELDINEAENRNYVGEDDTNTKAYITEGGVLYVEGKPSGWNIDNIDLTAEAIKVVYDGSTNWVGVIKFYKK